MTQLPQKIAAEQARAPVARRVGIVEGALADGATPEARFASLAALFPAVEFASLPAWSDRAAARADLVIVPVNALSAAEVDGAVQRLGQRQGGARVVIALFDADVMTTRRLAHAGAADVLPAPLSEPALALSLERLLAAPPAARNESSPRGEIVVFLKAGGGVGASALLAQLAMSLAPGLEGGLGIVDLDLQMGVLALYLDMAEAVTIADLSTAAGALAEVPFATALTAHRSSARLLAAPREPAPLETLAPAHIDALFTGLRRSFALSLIDLPSAWTAWTSRALYLADRIVLVTQLTVPHVNLAKRQLRLLAGQGLEAKPLLLVCNALTGEQQQTLSLKSAERALGRGFDAVLPEDRRGMLAAINQGVELAAIRRDTRLQREIATLANEIVPARALRAQGRGR
ncbi:MAG TPA: hypothetical protein VGS12_16055 [Caulobacteraceae bacterium]|nr:hypothetical protein [Caulobacteraceae bacterium]